METSELLIKAQQGDAKSQLELGREILMGDARFPEYSNPEGVKWVREAIFNEKGDEHRGSAVITLVDGYPRCNEATFNEVHETLNRLIDKFKNPVAMLELGRAYIGDTESAYWIRFREFVAHSNPEKGIQLLDNAVKIAESGDKNPFDSEHYRGAVSAYRFCVNEQLLKEKISRVDIIKRYLSCAEKAVIWAEKHAKSHNLQEDYLEALRYIEETARERLARNTSSAALLKYKAEKEKRL